MPGTRAPAKLCALNDPPGQLHWWARDAGSLGRLMAEVAAPHVQAVAAEPAGAAEAELADLLPGNWSSGLSCCPATSSGLLAQSAPAAAAGQLVRRVRSASRQRGSVQPYHHHGRSVGD